MTRSEAWRAAYRTDRYLRNASAEALERRSQDIASNMLDVNNAGQITPGDVAKSGRWWELWTHILEELAIRGVPFGSAKLVAPDQFPWVSHPESPRGLRILRGRGVEAGDLVRLGQRDHIKDAMNLGRFRIAPAASYADPSLNPAIQDDELSVTAVRSGDGAVIHAVDPRTGTQGERIHAIGEMTISRTLNENFHVLCMTAGYTPRLLDDFGADAMLVVRNVDRFLLRIERAVLKARPDLTMAADVVSYYDPYRVRPDDLEPFFAKNFRYAYQREYRLVWHVPGLPLDSQPFFVEIGQMRDIATIHVLRS